MDGLIKTKSIYQGKRSAFSQVFIASECQTNRKHMYEDNNKLVSFFVPNLQIPIIPRTTNLLIQERIGFTLGDWLIV